MKMYTVKMYSDCDKTTTVLAGSYGEALELAKQETRQWVRSGDWGENGATVNARFAIVEDDEDEDDDWQYITVDVEPDHSHLIRKVTRGYGCGDDPDDHNWTSEGEGGCSQNPGVWATGGTSFVFASHCRDCGLHRIERVCGSQRNPGDHDTVEYSVPDDWCAECQSEDCDCKEVEN